MFRGWGLRFTSNDPKFTFDVNGVTQNNSYVQLLALLCVVCHCYVIYVKRPPNAS